MERLQELIQRTDTIQKINALQERVCKELFIYPRIDKKEKTKTFSKKISVIPAYPAGGSFFLAQCTAGKRAFGGLPGDCGYPKHESPGTIPWKMAEA